MRVVEPPPQRQVGVFVSVERGLLENLPGELRVLVLAHLLAGALEHAARVADLLVLREALRQLQHLVRPGGRVAEHLDGARRVRLVAQPADIGHKRLVVPVLGETLLKLSRLLCL